VNVLSRDREERIVTDLTRRNLLKTGAAAAAGLIAGAPAIVKAQSKEPIPIGTLCPLTGAGGAYGPDMQKAIVTVADRINKSGGIHGRPLQLFHEDSQTNPEAAVRAARKLIDVNHAVALMSTFASAVTLAVKPLAVESKVFYFSVSGADAITEGNHGGYIARTQPNTKLQGQVYAKWVLSRKEFKRVAYMALQTPFAMPFGDNFMGTLKAGGLTITDNLIYEDKKPSYRSEITRVLATNPDLIMIEGYTPDTVVIAKELYRAAYKGAILGPAFAVNAKFVEGAGAEVAEGVWAIDPAPSFDSPAYKQFLAAIPLADKNPYAPQAWDHMTMVGLALAAGRGEVSGSVIKDNLRAISNPPGATVTSYEDGARLLREGKKINYEGASGSCDFDAQGDILSRPFGVYQVRKGKIEQVTIINP
jgi:branched-chain amino acid transport system substrate-binding protein